MKFRAVLMLALGFGLGFGSVGAYAQPIGQDSQLMAQAAKKRPKFVKTSINDGSGAFIPVLKITQPDAEDIYIKIGEQGLTRSILFDKLKLRDYQRDWLRAQNAAKKKKG